MLASREQGPGFKPQHFPSPPPQVSFNLLYYPATIPGRDSGWTVSAINRKPGESPTSLLGKRLKSVHLSCLTPVREDGSIPPRDMVGLCQQESSGGECAAALALLTRQTSQEASLQPSDSSSLMVSLWLQPAEAQAMCWATSSPTPGCPCFGMYLLPPCHELPQM